MVVMVAPVRAASITQHPLPKTAENVQAITSGPYGLVIAALPETSSGGAIYDTVTTTPAFTIKPGPAGLAASELFTGPDGNLWYQNQSPLSTVVDVTGGGQVVKVPTGPLSGKRDSFASIGATTWTANLAGSIERLAPDGKITTEPIPFPVQGPVTIVAAPDGSLWFTELQRGFIGEITPVGEAIEHPIANGESLPGSFGFTCPYGIAVGPDGALWFTELHTGRIGRMTETGALQEFTILTTESSLRRGLNFPTPRNIVAGPDGAMWFTDPGDGSIGRISMTGEITEFPVPTKTNAIPEVITSYGGELWFSEESGVLGSLNPAGTTAPPPPTTTKAAPVATKAQIAAFLARSLRTGALRKTTALKHDGQTLSLVAPATGTLSMEWHATSGHSHGPLIAVGRLAFHANRGTLHLKLTAGGRRLLAKARHLEIVGRASFVPETQAAIAASIRVPLKP